MRKNHTTNSIRHELSGRGIELIGEFVTMKTKTLFKCHCGNEWFAMPDKIVGKAQRGCPICSKVRASLKLSMNETEVRSRLASRGILLLGEYKNAKTRSTYQCQLGHVWEAIPDNLLKKSNPTGCPVCDLSRGRSRITRDTVTDRLQKRGIDIIGEFNGFNGTTLFQCARGHQWVTSPLNVKGCPKCADYGFNPSKPSWEYAFIRHGYLKIGITNNLEQRLATHKRHGEFEIVHARHHQNGQLALDWERAIKLAHVGRFASRDECPDGWTETFPIHILEEIRRDSDK